MIIPRFKAIRKAMEVIEQVVYECKSFKIGKSHDLGQRMKEPDYDGVYDHMESLFTSGSKELVGFVEASFIDACMADFPDKCDNKKDGEKSLNDPMPESKEYHVYIVWR